MAMIQIRNVPDDLHRRLKARAALAGLTLSDYLNAVIRDVAEVPTRDELLARLDALPPVTGPITPADAVREERENR